MEGVITSNGTQPGVPKGVAPGARIWALKVLADNGSGHTSKLLNALNFLVSRNNTVGEEHVEFVNLSLSSYAEFGGKPADCQNTIPAIGSRISLLRNSTITKALTFAASGNSTTKSAMEYPACIPGVISVGGVHDATTQDANCPSPQPDKAWCYSQSAPGSSVTNDLDLLAPADKITTTDVGGGFISTSGTSLASPHAVGVAVLLRKALPGLSMAELENRIKLAGKWVRDDFNDSDEDTYRWTQRVDARVALLTNDSADYDGGGCTNGQEFGTEPNLGGRRNPLNPYDYFDPTHEGQVRVNDILLVVH